MEADEGFATEPGILLRTPAGATILHAFPNQDNLSGSDVLFSDCHIPIRETNCYCVSEVSKEVFAFSEAWLVARYPLRVTVKNCHGPFSQACRCDRVR
jgi:hypothetical protein